MKRKKLARRLGKAARKSSRSVYAADEAVAAAVKPYRDTLPARAAASFATLGDQPPMLGLAAGTLASGIYHRDRRLARTGARMIAAHLIATAVKNVGKRQLDRTRPRTDGRHRIDAGASKSKATRSFPSGHSAGAVAVARAFARDYPEHGSAALGAAGAIALGQVPRRAHYLSDIGAGILIGLAAEKLAAKLLRPLGPSAE